MRISIERCRVAPRSQRKPQAMIDSSGSNSEMQRFESCRPRLRVLANSHTMQRFESCHPNRPVSL